MPPRFPNPDTEEQRRVLFSGFYLGVFLSLSGSDMDVSMSKDLFHVS